MMGKVVTNEMVEKRTAARNEEAAALDILVTAEHVRIRGVELFKSKDLTQSQYNVLRILRGAGNDGLSCSEIGERMITRDSDITRMLDRMEARELISRERQTADRRVVLTFLSENGRRLLAELDGPVREMHEDTLRSLTKKELETLRQLLRKARGEDR